jgi:8-oxo-dGTP pyrophosphatase MutT (NUDIX family)
VGRTTIEGVRGALRRRPPATIDEPVGTRAAVALILRETTAGLELLFIHRAEHADDPWSGHVAFPGGRAEHADRDLTATAVRETREEIEIDLVRCGEPLGALDEVRAMARGRPVDLAIRPYVFWLRQAAEPRPSPEVDSVFWLALDDLLGPAWRSTLERTYQGVPVQLPCFRIDDHLIWGLTFRMFESLEARLREAATAEVPSRMNQTRSSS